MSPRLQYRCIAAAGAAFCALSSSACTSSTTSTAAEPGSKSVSATSTVTSTLTSTPTVSTAQTTSQRTTNTPTRSATKPTQTQTSTMPTVTATATATAPTRSATTHTPHPTGGVCTSNHLRLIFSASGGAGGTQYSTYRLVNTGSHTCTMRGYPGVSIIDAHGHTVEHPARRGSVGTHAPVPVETVSVGPGRSGYFLLTSVNVTPSPGCATAFHGSRLRVYPPNNTVALYLHHRAPFCNAGVGPVTQFDDR